MLALYASCGSYIKNNYCSQIHTWLNKSIFMGVPCGSVLIDMHRRAGEGFSAPALPGAI